jgi:hypothetical protein
VSSLRESGPSLRAIAAATGISHDEARRSLPPVTNLTRAPDPLDLEADELAEELIAADAPGPVPGSAPSMREPGTAGCRRHQQPDKCLAPPIGATKTKDVHHRRHAAIKLADAHILPTVTDKSRELP